MKAAIREAVGIFHDEKSLLAAMDELEMHGFNRAQLSMLAGERTVQEKLGYVYKRVEELEDNPDVPRDAIFCPECIGTVEGALFSYPLYIAATAATGVVVASGGTLLAAITAAAAAGIGGGLIGGVLAYLVGKHHADYLQDQIEHGGLLLWVSLPDKEHEDRAVKILKKFSARDVHVHDIAIDKNASVAKAYRTYLSERKAA